jgi:imidazolonepropionase-like amidohydrolase
VGGASVKILLAIGWMSLVSCSRERHLVTHDPAATRTFCLRNVRVFDAPHATMFTGFRDVVVREGRIAAIAPAGMQVSGAPEIDGAGAALLPGLVDLHVHLGADSGPPWRLAMPHPQRNLEAFLYAGVTTVLDLGNLTPDVFRLRDAVARGDVLGPRVFAAGPMFTTPKGHPVALLRLALPWWLRWYVIPRFSREVATPQEARTQVGELAGAHPDVLKIAVDRVPFEAPRLTPEVIAALAASAHEHGIRCVAHVGRSADVIDAIHGGVDALAHVVYLEEMSDAAVEAVAAKHAPVIATISVFDSQERFLLDRPPPYLDIEREVTAPEVLDALRTVPPSFDRKPVEAVLRAMIDGHEARRRNVAKLRRAGVVVLAGSDSPNFGHFPGASLHLELRDLVEAGMTPGEALRAATYDSARFLSGPSADFGEVSLGKRADLLLVDGDPVADGVAALDHPRAVFLDGMRLSRHPVAEGD